MTVRWKPLIVLSGLFLISAVMGLLAITYAWPGRSEDVLPQAQKDAKAKKYDNALIHYRRALQLDQKNVSIHEELAEMIARWMVDAPKKRAELRPMRIRALTDAAKYGKGRPGPRRQLLADALARDDASDALEWANELISIEPKDPAANYVKALESLDHQPPDLATAKAHLAVLTAAAPTGVRTLWVRARLARETGDSAALSEVFQIARTTSPDAALSASERLTRLRLHMMEIAGDEDPKTLVARVSAFGEAARTLASEPEPSSSRTRLLGSTVKDVQRHLKGLAARTPASKNDLASLGDSLETVAEAIYTRAIENSGASNLNVHLDFAEHLVFRDQAERALTVASRALKLPIASLPAWEMVAASLRESAVKAALSRTDDPSRFEKAAPFIKDLSASANPRLAGMGHFFKGLIALDKSGLTSPAAQDPGDSKTVTIDPKARDEAVSELKLAAAALPDASTAQALYGVTMILTGEQGMGRQYLQRAYHLGGQDRLEPRYQVWAAWSMLQAGYPEDAEPIIAKLLADVARGELPVELGPTLHLLKGEAHQARGTPEQLRLARVEFQKGVPDGQPMPANLQLRLAQIDLQLGESQQGMSRLAKLKGDAKIGPSAERLIVLSLKESGKLAEATKALASARTRYPDSDELAELDSVLHASANDNAGADRVLAEYLEKHPGRVALSMLRAKFLATTLKKPADARAILVGLSRTAETSAPLAELAILDITGRDFDAAAKTIAQIRARWKEASTADLLDAQLALARENPRAAASHLEAALKKDPNNKVAQLWKAILDERSGGHAKASQALESILKDQPVKEIEDGLSLTTAAKWALADMALQNQDLETAIRRFESLLQGGQSKDLDRSVRWKLVAARAGRGELEQAKADVAALLASPTTTPDERVQAADFYRRHGDDASCMAQLDSVLKADPSHTGAIAYKALSLASKDRPDDAVKVLRSAIAGKKSQPSNIYLMLAAAENLRLPKEQATARALAALDEGLASFPSAIELIQAKFQVMKLKGDANAIAFVEKVAKADPSPAMKRVLAEAYRENQSFASAEAVVRDLLKETPKDARLAASLVGLIAMQSKAAIDRGDKASARSLDIKTTELIRHFRAEFPDDVTFPQAECELAARNGDMAKAKRISGEITTMDASSPIGPLLRAQLYATENKTEEVVRAYDEALKRSPRRTDIRLAFAQANLALGKTDETLKQAKLVLDSDSDQPTALLLRAQALVLQPGTPEERAARRTEAAGALREAIRANPKFLDAYHVLAEIRLMDDDRAKALITLREGLRVNPNDDSGLSALIQHLSEPRGRDQPAPPADLQEAMQFAQSFEAKDERGVFALASAVGFQRAGHVDLALPWAEKAAKKIDRPIVHLTYGDILLAKAESTSVPAEAKENFLKAVAQYEAVLKSQPDQIEAVNNKAWILHRYLNRNPEALELAEGFAKGADLTRLPAEFLDTLGSIQEGMGQAKKAEDTYTKGLRNSPNHPMLNYHLGKLLSKDRSRASKAADCLEKAKAAKSKLSPAIVRELDATLESIGR
ncbi:MAG: hypothetical protein JWN86_1635 [Planctomycetota bacterium]|nr:hypothetical protein [Planctomycetota bacterium]